MDHGDPLGEPGEEGGLLHGGVPANDDDMLVAGEGRYVGELDDAGGERDTGARQRAPSDPESLGLPDHEGQRDDEDGDGEQHAYTPSWRHERRSTTSRV